MNRTIKIPRDKMIEDIVESEPFDLLVIGVGITGCGIALDATLRGIRLCRGNLKPLH